jgi:hypothetical protein
MRCCIGPRTKTMNLFARLRSLFSNFVVPAEHLSLEDSTAYHSPANEQELRFSPRDALRRHY